MEDEMSPRTRLYYLQLLVVLCFVGLLVMALWRGLVG